MSRLELIKKLTSKNKDLSYAEIKKLVLSSSLSPDEKRLIISRAYDKAVENLIYKKAS